jgi:hypothetical protein
MNKGGFSWKRAVGITRAKQSISRATGIPLTKSGRQRKVGKMVTGGGCVLSISIFLIIISIIATLIFIGCSFSSSKTQEDLPDSVEYKLATLDNGYVEENDSIINSYKILLDKLEKKTVNTRIDIADITVTAQKLLKEHGIDKSLLGILKDFDNSIPASSPKLKLEEVASLYMVLMTD